uniref:C2H2-type domain-containing protein n=1 Tax=Neogobius melanostomus TaxID=47308 RepID=A0A8C6S7R0_9GOBI
MSLGQTRLSSGVQMLSPDLGLNQEAPQIKEEPEEPEEHGIKQEDEQLPVSVPESSAVCVKSEESVSSETHFHFQTQGHSEHSSDTDNDDDWEPSSCSDAQIETGADPGAVGKKYMCPFCQKSYCTKQGLQKHSRVHTGERPYSCSLCSKTFSHKESLVLHMRIHTGERPYICSICEKDFSDPATFKST